MKLIRLCTVKCICLYNHYTNLAHFYLSTYFITFVPVVCQLLHEEWANYGVMHKYQPVDLIRYSTDSPKTTH